LNGLKICITGTIAGYTRVELGRELTALGAIMVDGVGKSTDVLIAGDGAGSKMDKAQKFGVKIIGENRLRDFMAGGKME